jgi:hypothetical protein
MPIPLNRKAVPALLAVPVLFVGLTFSTGASRAQAAVPPEVGRAHPRPRPRTAVHDKPRPTLRPPRCGQDRRSRRHK